jgi:hypothetical protein
MNAILFATGLALLALAGPAHASWAENANMRNPIYTGTDRSLAQAQHGLDRSTTARIHRPYSMRRHHHRAWR